MDKSVISAIDDFYALKQDYENEIKIKKQKIRKNKTLNQTQKKQKISEIKPKCVNCGKLGGTQFIIDDVMLKAICGNTQEPCKLNIEIQRSYIEPLNKVYNFLNLEDNEYRENIIKNKLDMLYGYISENEALQNFETLRTDLYENTNYLDEVKKMFNNIIHNERNKKDIKQNNLDLTTSIKKLKDLSIQYDNDNNPQLIRDMIELYNSEIIPSVNRLRNLKYSYSAVECETGEFYPCDKGTSNLVQMPYTRMESEFYLNGSYPTLISNTK